MVCPSLVNSQENREMSAPLFHMIEGAPAPVAPYSHAVEADGWVFVTGQMPNDPDDDDKPLAQGIESQTRKVMENLQVVLAGLGLGLEHRHRGLGRIQSCSLGFESTAGLLIDQLALGAETITIGTDDTDLCFQLTDAQSRFPVVDDCQHLGRADSIALLHRNVGHPARHAAADGDQVTRDARVGLGNMGDAIANFEAHQHDYGEDDDEYDGALNAAPTVRRHQRHGWPYWFVWCAIGDFGTRIHGTLI